MRDLVDVHRYWLRSSEQTQAAEAVVDAVVLALKGGGAR